MQFRRKEGAVTEQVTSTVTAPHVIQLIRKDGKYSMSVAKFGDAFSPEQLDGVELGDKVYVGLFVCAHNAEVLERAVFRNVRVVIPAPDNFRPYRDYIGSHLEVMDVETGHRKVVHSVHDSLQAPNWTPDNRALIFNRNGRRYDEFDKAHQDANDPLAGVSSRPDFAGLLYPGPTPFTRDPDTSIPRSAPPSFLATAGSGDRVHAIWAIDYFNAMLRAGIPNIELHVYGNGVHAGGLKVRDGIPFGTWQDRYVDWFRDLGFLQKPGEPTKAAIDSAAFVESPPRGRRFNRPPQRP
jgi:hypothetical protein